MSEQITVEQAQQLIEQHARQRMEQIQVELAVWLREHNCELGAVARLVPDANGKFVIEAVPQIFLLK